MASIVFIGVKGSGKTTLINKIFFQNLISKPPTLTETKYDYNGISIYDTPGLNGSNKSLTKHNTSTMYVIVIDSSQPLGPQSEAIVAKIATLLGFENNKILLIATKCDLPQVIYQKEITSFLNKLSKDFNVDVKLVVSSPRDNETISHELRNIILNIHLKKVISTIRKEVDKFSWAVSLFQNHQNRKKAILAAIDNAGSYAVVKDILLTQINIFKRSANLTITSEAAAISPNILDTRWTQQNELVNKVTIDNIYASPFYRRIKRAYQLTMPDNTKGTSSSPTSGSPLAPSPIR